MRLRTLFWLPVALAVPLMAGTVGRLVPMRGAISDIALDERRQVLYAANFTANRIEIMSLADLTVKGSLPMSETPYVLALSQDQRFLVAGHFLGGLTVFDLDANQRAEQTLQQQVVSVVFGAGSDALVVTKSGFYLLNPLTNVLTALPITGSVGSCNITVNPGTKPIDVVGATAGVSGDGQTVYILARVTNIEPPECKPEEPDNFYLLEYRPLATSVVITGASSKPALGPRVVSVDRDGNNFLAGWALYSKDPATGYRFLRAQFPNIRGAWALGGHAYDFRRNVIYAQVPILNNTATSAPPVLHLLDTDNLTVRKIVNLPNPIAGRSVFSADLNYLFAVAESGVLVLPLEDLDTLPQIEADREDLLFQSNSCDRTIRRQTFRIVDPSGRGADFTIKVPEGTRGVRVFPASGTAPATITVEVDPIAFQSQQGTVAVNLSISTSAGINLPWPVRVLVNTRDFDQRGTIVNVPGKIVDVVADPYRPRVYVLRQDRNRVVVLDANTYEQLAWLRTANTPVQMAITLDGKYLITTADNSQILTVHDLDTFEQLPPIIADPGRYTRSITVTQNEIWATARLAFQKEACSGGGSHELLRVDLYNRRATPPARLGIYANCISENAMLSATPSAALALLAQPNGSVLLYESSANTWVVGRKDFDSLSGAVGAFNDNVFVVRDNVLDMALFPVERRPLQGTPSGLGAVPGAFYLRTAATPQGPGFIEKIDVVQYPASRFSRLVESPLVPVTTQPVNLIGETILPFTRTLAIAINPGRIFSASTSGLTALDFAYDAPVPMPSIASVLNIADNTQAVGPGSLVLIRGTGLATAAETGGTPWPSSLDQACVLLNGNPLPLGRVSGTEILVHIPFSAASGQLVVRSAGGVSAAFPLTVEPAAPAIFRDGAAGPLRGLATLVRQANNELVTFSNPIQPGDRISIYLTGMGRVFPDPGAGVPAPAEPVSSVVLRPTVTIGDTPLTVDFAGLEPGRIGVYRIDATVPWWVRNGQSLPLIIRQGTFETSVDVRVVPKP
jgi:uncharacterized protein (TIGR03437 family)